MLLNRMAIGMKAGGVYGRVDAPAIPSGALLIDSAPVLIDGFYIIFS